jgi:hypothetical protein
MGTAQAAPFSHRTHLQQKLQCITCHGSATASTRADDNNLPNPAICLGCHTGTTGKPAKLPEGAGIKQPRQTMVSKFNHQLHGKLGNIAPLIARAIDRKEYLSNPGDLRQSLNTKNACAACHRGLESSDQVSHAAFPHMADCLVCHNQIDPPFSCEKCHVPTQKLTPSSHTEGWLDLHSSGKSGMDKTTCAVCHGRKFTCRGCH